MSYIMLLLILLLGAFFRFYDLQTLPPGLYPDEAMNGSNALQAIHTGEFKLFYPENNGREGLFINIQALSIWLLGTTARALRIVSAIFGTLTILGVYFFTKELFSVLWSQSQNQKSKIQNDNLKLKKAPIRWATKILHFDFCILHSSTEDGAIPRNTTIALLASFFIATSYWHINFSRIGFRAIMLPFLLSFGLYWLLKGLRTENIWSLTLAGIFIGAGFHSYIAFRFVPFIIAVPMAWYLRQYQIQNAKLKNQNDPEQIASQFNGASNSKFKIT
ncbi:hypothetical protein KGQ34_03020, partial [Patescibacteria group bacterium]|nr:hypothetical protein [Patescibacteria group bacterium]